MLRDFILAGLLLLVSLAITGPGCSNMPTTPHGASTTQSVRNVTAQAGAVGRATMIDGSCADGRELGDLAGYSIPVSYTHLTLPTIYSV